MPHKLTKDAKEYHRRWTENNRDKRNSANKRTLAAKKVWFSNLVKETRLKCAHCGEDHPGILEFHHVDPTAKEFTIGSGWRNASRNRILEEINKCIVLCANCHRKLHFAGDAPGGTASVLHTDTD